MSVAPVAKLIRKDLKASFPETKFGVYSDNNSVRVVYMDGPTSDEVKAIVGKYQEGSFNGMEYIYEYSNQQDFPQARYVFIERDWSEVTKEYIFSILRIPKSEELEWRADDRCNNCEYARRMFAKTVFSEPGVEKSFDPIEIDNCVIASPNNAFGDYWFNIARMVKVVQWAVKKGFLTQTSATQIEWSKLGTDWTEEYIKMKEASLWAERKGQKRLTEN